MEKAVEQLNKIFNLSKYEARIYLAALNYEEANLTDLAKRANIARTAAYEPLKSLLGHGFLTSVKIRKRTFYRAVDPKQLKFMLERKQVELKDLVSNLEKHISVPDRKLDVAYYDGKDGWLLASDIWLDQARTKDARAWENADDIAMGHGGTQLYEYIKKRVKKGIRGRSIIHGDVKHPYMKERLRHDKDELRDTLLTSPHRYPIKCSIGILDDTVLILTTGNNPFALMIKHKDIATTLWSIHDMVWDRYRGN